MTEGGSGVGKDTYPTLVGRPKLVDKIKERLGFSKGRSVEPTTPVVAGRNAAPGSYEPTTPVVVGQGRGGENRKEPEPPGEG